MDKGGERRQPGWGVPYSGWFLQLFGTVSARMIAIIFCAAGPMAIIAGFQAWNSYRHTLQAPAFRADMAISRIDLEVRHDVDHIGALLSSVSRMSLDENGFVRTLQMARSLTGEFYRLALLDDEGRVLLAVNGDTPLPLPDQVPYEDLPRFSGDVRVVQLDIPSPDTVRHSYIRVTLSTPIADSLGTVRSGFLTAVMPVVWSRHHLQIGDPRLDFMQKNGAIDAWIIGRDRTLSPLCDDCASPGPPPPDVVRWLGGMTSVQRDTRQTLSVGDAAFAYGPIEGGVAALTMTRRNPAETQALVMFVIWLFIIVSLLGLCLIMVTQSANALLIAPLRRLTDSVERWQAGDGVFNARSNWVVPVEIRQLARAFTQATRSLARDERRLARAAVRQELLLKEMHHRVKNNLQIVASLLNLQANRIRQTEAREEFAQARDRVRALATLHRYLYAEGELFSMNMEHFVTELCSQIMQAAGHAGGGRLDLSVHAATLELEPDQAVPLALIITEIVSNAIKHAFADGRRGTISVRLERVEPSQARLDIADDGIGLAGGYRLSGEERSGIGMQLIRGFARQLGGSLKIIEEDGTRYILLFPLKAEETGDLVR
ncbi:sensor histidine kinase [Gluconacetobacter tumulicola]|uniref:histidine kinase n=1 Tax=Gluconacetobacter tumulicola TaxID=1017177 RepID=A0A7W4JBL7_9PROT|nr:histidine kinase dimerization/phosphoacceptor domain -containing protein [Gluconacetobacter tumulicola]MBB2178221.1 sensor histidine kinase [Gluconacetobacter tumulicola]